MTFDIISRRLVFREVVTSLIVVPPNNPPHNDAPATQTHNIGFDTTYWIVSFEYVLCGCMLSPTFGVY